MSDFSSLDEEAREFIGRHPFCRAALEEFGAMLPADDFLLKVCLGVAIREADEMAYTWTISAAILAGRTVDPWELLGGWELLGDGNLAGAIAWQMHGEIVEALIHVLLESRLSQEMNGVALWMIVLKCRESGMAYPEPLFTLTRQFARWKDCRDHPKTFLTAVADALDDPGVWEVVVEKLYGGKLTPQARKAALDGAAIFTRHVQQPFCEFLPQEAARVVSRGKTMRRAVVKVGRNEPCPCGSGKKYKRCCAAADEERRCDPSEVEGVTAEELYHEPETGLTLARLEAMMPRQLSRLTPAKVPEDLRKPLLLRLAVLGEYQALVSSFECYGVPEEFIDVWDAALFYVMRAQDRDVAQQLVELRYPGGLPAGARLRTGLPLLLAERVGEDFLRELEKMAAEALQTEDSEQLQEIAIGIISNIRVPALGILIARSMIPLTEKAHALLLLEQILHTRDHCGLPPEDPFEDVIDRRFTEEVAGQDARKLREAQRQLEAKAAETRAMKERLEELRRHLALREKRENTEAAKAAAIPAEDLRAGELQEKIGELKGMLKERHAERAELRRALETAHADLETLRQLRVDQPRTDLPALEADEERLTTPVDLSDYQPVRLLEFPPKFHQHLLDFPKQIARAAMIMLGRLAGGDPTAFVGIVMLKQVPEALRIRIGSDHRLIFRLLPDRVQVLDLINRRDLDRRLKTL